jgi:hypothetical protein
VVHAINVEGYQDNMIAIAILSAAVTAVLLAVQHRRAVIAAVILVGACGTAHWNVFGVVAATLLLTALFLLPWSVGTGRSWRRVLADSPAGRVVQVTAGGSAVAVTWIGALLTAPLPTPRLDEAQFVFKAHRDLPSYHLSLTLPAAAGGALSLAASDHGEGGIRSRAFLALMLAWCQVTLLFFVWGWVFGKPVPTHRVLAMCLAIPILALVGLVWVADWAGRRWKPLAAVIVLVGLAISASWAQATWLTYRPVMRPAVLVEAGTAARYLDAVGVETNRPVVFVIDDRSTFGWSNAWLVAQTIRAALPPGRIVRTYFYVGRPEDYLGRRPSSLAPDARGGPPRISPSRYEAFSGSYFGAMAQTYQRHPVAVILRSSNPGYEGWAANHPDRVVDPGVAVVRGPLPPAPVEPELPPAPLALPALAGLGLGALALLALMGGGWGWFLLGEWLGRIELAALAPAVGAAVGVLGGALLAAARVPLRGFGGILIAAVVAAGGWAAALARRHTAAPGERNEVTSPPQFVH